MPKQILSTPSAPAALGPYSVGVEANGIVFFSGQIALDADGNPAGTTAEQAQQVMTQIGGLLSDVGLEFSDVVKATIFLADMGDFAAVNDVYGSFFDSEPPARSAVEVAALPKGVSVEIETIATK
ncbi:MAG: reactive intermediate/imine deaminase [Acidimicrobiia bacterium]|nr:Rid family detoxifying hydrolase [Acidimicrobiia bacterium]MBT8192030.1 Rid family detoxifying hydrolase [Acidimicrobiia bacterium]NNF88299.1 reactive intermediate/imine deaminase [Acidimicrobiia bacterium]NNJ46882.1 reactive intermediate/imine deaminase [Acidimicrobiia bacterium]NNL12141.1 reactive intermediate/imine deaminase [Acidimicrobiia bacterium]